MKLNSSRYTYSCMQLIKFYALVVVHSSEANNKILKRTKQFRVSHARLVRIKKKYLINVLRMQHDSLHILRKAIIRCTHRVRCIIIQLDGVQNVSEKKLRGLCKISYITYLPPIYDRLLLSPDLRIECTACGGKFDNISARFRVQISSMYRININNNLHTRETTIYFGFYTDHIIIYYIHFKWNRFWAARPPPPCPPEYNMHNKMYTRTISYTFGRKSFCIRRARSYIIITVSALMDVETVPPLSPKILN